jgi:hypothetical protein
MGKCKYAAMEISALRTDVAKLAGHGAAFSGLSGIGKPTMWEKSKHVGRLESKSEFNMNKTDRRT